MQFTQQLVFNHRKTIYSNLWWRFRLPI